ncbi:PAS domain-containing sensor histidine kinase [Anaerobacillus arseniciselenatis]|uniref:histidine kinase n=1 Tax=Anaerobacillus arseniciselenatis TaxID=85682 RepID=A0A1S2LFW7_9BACI|nr:ATP-binding protein [Anaerobacillus arseniciselenatis]OIJ10963.1 PAS domain-containing sensor histidine kinase [Anaerobacillus arseniciselenatis]
MYKYRNKLTISLLIAVFFVLAGLGISLGQIFKDFYFDHVSERLSKEARIVAISVLEAGLHDEDLSKIVNDVGEQLATRVTVILHTGEVIAETEAPLNEMENHLHRPELIQVREEGEGQAIRYSETLGAELLYYAVPLIDDRQIIGYVRLGITIHMLNEVNKKIWVVLLVSITAAFLLIIVLSFRITNEMTRPIEKVTAVANQLAKGNFKARASEVKNDETGQLSRSLNILAQNLEEITRTYEAQQERLETLIENMGSGLILINNKGEVSLINKSCKKIFHEDIDHWLTKVYHKVIPHKQIIKIVQEIFLSEKGQKKHIILPIQLEMRHFDVYGAPIISSGGKESLKGIVLVFHDITELKKLEQMRKDFVANVSHELKTPITSVKGFTETLLDGAAEDEALRKQFLNIIWDESERLQNLIQDLLDLSKIEHSEFQLNWQRVDLSMLTDDVIVMLKGKAKQKDISLTKVTEGSSTIEGDPLRIKQVMINLINNAIMYTPQGGRININVTETNEKVIFGVKDTGIGISKQEVSRVFERFYRVDRARSRNSGGTGLGLAIVKHIVEAHQGEIIVDSEVGKGTLFAICFNKKAQL